MSLSDGYKKVLVAEPCHKIASLIYQDIALAFYKDIVAIPSDDLLELLHQIARSLDQAIPEIAKATDQRLKLNLVLNKAKG